MATRFAWFFGVGDGAGVVPKDGEVLRSVSAPIGGVLEVVLEVARASPVSLGDSRDVRKMSWTRKSWRHQTRWSGYLFVFLASSP